MQNFFLSIAKMMFAQIVSVFGIFLVFGFILSRIQTFIVRNYQRSVGWRGVLWTAWLGTPVHEYSHELVALIFGHRITEVVLFAPDPKTGELGHVSHSYNRHSLYQNIGNFFIGLAPLIIGPILLTLMLYFLVPRGGEAFGHLVIDPGSWTTSWQSVKNFLLILFSPADLLSFRFWLVLYLSFCIASHLAPSRSDLHGAWAGGSLIIVCLFLVDALAFLLNWNISQYIIGFSSVLAGFAAIYVYVLLIDIFHFLLSWLIFRLFRRK